MDTQVQSSFPPASAGEIDHQVLFKFLYMFLENQQKTFDYIESHPQTAKEVVSELRSRMKFDKLANAKTQTQSSNSEF